MSYCGGGGGKSGAGWSEAEAEAATLGEAVTIVAAGGSNAGNSLRMMGSLDSEGGRKTF